MAGFQRNIGRRAIRHANVRSKTHAEDVAANNERRKLYWLGVEQKREDSHRIIPGLGDGLYFVREHPLHEAHLKLDAELQSELAAIKARVNNGSEDSICQSTADDLMRDSKKAKQEKFEKVAKAGYTDSGNFLEVRGTELEKRLDTWHADTCYYYREITDKKCLSGKRWKRTPHAGIQGHVVTAAPWWSNVIYEAAEAGDVEKVRELATLAAHELAKEYQKETKRRVLSVQAHFDTTSMHWHVFSTRVAADHRFVHGSTKKFGLIGPWATGVLRQAEVQAIPEGSTNAKQARRRFSKNVRRYGSNPLDWQLAKVVDAVCFSTFGVSPRFSYWLGVYRKGLAQTCIDALLGLRDACAREASEFQRHETMGLPYSPRVSFAPGVTNGGGTAVGVGDQQAVNLGN